MKNENKKYILIKNNNNNNKIYHISLIHENIYYILVNALNNSITV